MRERLTGAKLAQIVIVLLVLVAAFWWKTVKNETSDTTPEPVKMTRCDIADEPCTLTQGDLTATAQLQSEQLAAELPFTLSVLLSESQAKVVKSRIEGHTMYMGTLPAIIKEVQPGKWEGQALVGSCTEKSMIWAWVMDVEYEGNTEQFKFLFEVVR